MNDSSGPVLSVPDLQGEWYTEFLSRMHRLLAPKSYLEIGTRLGDSLSLASCPSIAIDVQFTLRPEAIGGKSFCGLFQMPSDDFFERYRPELFFQRPLDFAFIDGLHLFEVAIRDFCNIEASCRKTSVVAFHDCIPTDIHNTTRLENDIETRSHARHPDWWVGDVWKIPIILAEYRPDLKIYAFDAGPSGILLVTNLEPASTVLKDRYFEIVERFRGLRLVDYGLEKFHRSLAIRAAASVSCLENLSELVCV